MATNEMLTRYVALSGDGSVLATGSHDATVHLWSVTDSEFTSIKTIPTKFAVRAISLSADCTKLAAGVETFVNLWDTKISCVIPKPDSP
jgi:WD40 repeat protein